MTTTEARQAVASIGTDLLAEKFDSETFYLHVSCDLKARCRKLLHLLPSYDEYLISYKDRTSVMLREHHPKAFNTYGIFYPVILYNGRIIGNWKKDSKKKDTVVETSLFDESFDLPEDLLKKAAGYYCSFHTKK